MKKFFAFIIGLLLVVTSCSASRYVSLNDPEVEFSATEILYNRYPELVNYYEAGVLKITALREIRTEMGYDYKLKYRFVKRHLEYAERMEVLKELYPELYTMYVNGTIEITSMYKYVDAEGAIRYHVSYRRLYDFYYESVPLIHPYGGYRYYYRPRPAPAPRPHNPPAVRPHNPKPNNPPAVRPNNPRPNNPPQARPNNPRPQSGGGGVRPGGNSRPGGGSHGPSGGHSGGGRPSRR